MEPNKTVLFKMFANKEFVMALMDDAPYNRTVAQYFFNVVYLPHPSPSDLAVVKRNPKVFEYIQKAGLFGSSHWKFYDYNIPPGCANLILDMLPPEIISLITRYLIGTDILSLAFACHDLRHVIFKLFRNPVYVNLGIPSAFSKHERIAATLKYLDRCMCCGISDPCLVPYTPGLGRGWTDAEMMGIVQPDRFMSWVAAYHTKRAIGAPVKRYGVCMGCYVRYNERLVGISYITQRANRFANFRALTQPQQDLIFYDIVAKCGTFHHESSFRLWMYDVAEYFNMMFATRKRKNVVQHMITKRRTKIPRVI
jgi:hypothetical protein